MSLVFVPLTRDDLAGWARSGSLTPARAFAVTSGLRTAFGFAAPADTEDAEYTVMNIAGLAALLAGGERLVAVADAVVADTADEFGEVAPGGLDWAGVTALFAEGSAELAGPVRSALVGVTVAEAWDDSRVESLLSEGSLLWHDVSEWGTLV